MMKGHHSVYLVTIVLCSLLLAGCPGGGGNNDGGTLSPKSAATLNSNLTALSAGYRHACALNGSGAVQCWGDNTSGQLGDGTTDNAFSPVDVTGMTSGISAISSGLNFTCALTSGGGVQCLGGNQRGQLGDGTNINSATPVNVSGLGSGVTAVSAGMNFVCALTSGGGVKCLGDNRLGELGDSTTDDAYSAVDVSGLGSGVAAISAGEGVACALTTAGAVQCWGDNSYDELGSGATASFNVPTTVAGLGSGFAGVASGLDFACVLTTGGGVQCVGDNSSGQIGDGSADTATTPVDVTGLTSGVTAIAVGKNHACALTSAGAVKCWGDNTYGELGDGSTASSSIPVNVSGLGSGVTAITAGLGHTCALTTAGALQCWGNNAAGQLGNGKYANSTTPVTVTGLSSGVAAISAGRNFSCALTTGGTVKCWGDGSYGDLGNGSSVTSSLPVDVSGLSSGVTSISAGYLHACAVTSGGGVQCWGNNSHGQLGDGTTVNSAVPVAVSGLSSGVAALAVGNLNSCALTTGGGVKCWGDASYGELGNGSTVASATPVDATGLTSGVAVISASMGQNGTCAVTTGGAVQCWGEGTFTGGASKPSKSSIPVAITGLQSGVSAVSVGTHHACILNTAGGVQCWGNGSHGELGNGTTGPNYTVPDGATTSYSAIPVDVTGLTSGVAAVMAGRDFSCALTTGGGVKCWGENNQGQLGNGTTTSSSVPVDVSGLTSGVSAIAVGGTFACALTSAGQVKCWGDNLYGELGTSASTVAPISTVPVDVI